MIARLSWPISDVTFSIEIFLLWPDSFDRRDGKAQQLRVECHKIDTESLGQRRIYRVCGSQAEVYRKTGSVLH